MARRIFKYKTTKSGHLRKATKENPDDDAIGADTSGSWAIGRNESGDAAPIGLQKKTKAGKYRALLAYSCIHCSMRTVVYACRTPCSWLNAGALAPGRWLVPSRGFRREDCEPPQVRGEAPAIRLRRDRARAR